MKLRSLSALHAGALIGLLVAGPLGLLAAAAPPSPLPTGRPPLTGASLFIYRVPVDSPADVSRLTSGGWDVLEARGADHLLVLGDRAVGDALRAAGFTVEVERTVGGQDRPFSYYGGYRTVAEHYQHMADVAAGYPALARLIDYGDSWRQLAAQPNAHDLLALCLTRLRPGDCARDPETDKPRFFIMGAIHARELSTSELLYRWIDYLTAGYDADAEVTALLDHTEVWVVPVANPDGRHIVEQGGNGPYLQRKNANTSIGACADPPTVSNQFGVDLNRNASFMFGGAGTTTSACAQTYRGPGPASEPEAYFLEALLSQLFRDQRGPLITDTAPLTATGAMISLHTYSDLVLFPWGWTECFAAPCPPSQQAPNDAGLRAFAFRLAYHNGYAAGQPSELLYAASGTTDDFAYGQLGIAGFTFEVGPAGGACGGFTPPYACQDSTFWPLNRPAFLTAAKLARQPYELGRGPAALNVSVHPPTAAVGAPITLTALINDNTLGSSGVNRPTPQAVAQAEYYLGVPPWAGGQAVSLGAQDGVYDGTEEPVVGLVPTAGLAPGRHLLFVRGRSAAGFWGPTTAIWINVTGPLTRHYLPVVVR